MKRSKFNLSNYKLLSCDMGSLIPCGLYEVLPGDTVQHATSCLLRASPLLAPVYHPVHARIHHFFVPNRLLWDDWESFITGGEDGMDASVAPTITLTNPAVKSLADYLGVPPKTGNEVVSALPFRAYAMIWNEYYRDQDLQAKVPVDKASGSDATTNTTLLNCGWEKDYFTSSRPWEQKGPSVTIPLGTSASVGYDKPGFQQLYTSYPTYISDDSVGTGVTGGKEMFADLSTASAVTVNLLREALALQRYEEARARYGSRYVEYLRYLGVRSSDARLQRPEYIGGGRNTIQFSEVLQTAEGTDPVGSLKGHGIASMRSNRFRRYFEEHGLVLSLLSVRPKTMYSDGLHRLWTRQSKEDYFQQEFQHIGQQEVYNKEVYTKHTQPDGVFGYQDRYDEYRSIWSSIAGDFRNTLDFWHFARIFASDPALNADFIKCVPTERTFAVPSEDVLWIMARHSIQARRIVAARGSSFIM